MIRASFLLVLLATASLINAQRSGVTTVNVNTTTTVNGTVSNLEQENLVLNYTIGEVGIEAFDWNNEWFAEESGVNEFELLDGAGDIIYLVPAGNQAQNVDEILSEQVVNPSGNNSTVGSYVGNTLTKAYLPVQAVPVANPSALAPAANQQPSANVAAPVGVAVAPAIVTSPAVPEVVPAILTVAPAPEVAPVAIEASAAPEVAQAPAENVSEAAENVGQAVGTTVAIAAAPVAAAAAAVNEVAQNAVENVAEALPNVSEAVENVAENVSEAVNEAANDVDQARENVEEVLENPVGAVEDAAYDAGEDIGNAVSEVENVADNAVESVEDDVNAVRGAARTVTSSYRTGYNSARNNN